MFNSHDDVRYYLKQTNCELRKDGPSTSSINIFWMVKEMLKNFDIVSIQHRLRTAPSLANAGVWEGECVSNILRRSLLSVRVCFMPCNIFGNWCPQDCRKIGQSFGPIAPRHRRSHTQAHTHISTSSPLSHTLSHTQAERERRRI